jgi:hypothetical protein
MTHPVAIIGLLGNKRAGKTTLARYARDRYGARVVSVASPIRDMCDALVRSLCSTSTVADTVWDKQVVCAVRHIKRADGTVEEEVRPYDKTMFTVREWKEDATLAIVGVAGGRRSSWRPLITLRSLMQVVGTEMCRSALGEHVLAHGLVRSVLAQADASPTATLFVVDDVRTAEEVVYIRDVLSTLWRGTRHFGAIIKVVNLHAQPQVDSHATEVGVDAIPLAHLDDVVAAAPGEDMLARFDEALGRLTAAHPLFQQCAAAASANHVPVSLAELAHRGTEE